MNRPASHAKYRNGHLHFIAVLAAYGCGAMAYFLVQNLPELRWASFLIPVLMGFAGGLVWNTLHPTTEKLLFYSLYMLLPASIVIVRILLSGLSEPYPLHNFLFWSLASVLAYSLALAGIFSARWVADAMRSHAKSGNH